mmetsp:Transcript_18841/g.32414  ORF Transcript_18841/g.32414 Transcript_18841/m.32414 type:complete len:90 (+) Transcript_18841:58-327(+)
MNDMQTAPNSKQANASASPSEKNETMRSRGGKDRSTRCARGESSMEALECEKGGRRKEEEEEYSSVSDIGATEPIEIEMKTEKSRVVET